MGHDYERVDTEEEESLPDQIEPSLKPSILRQWKTTALASFLFLCTGLVFFLLGAWFTLSSSSDMLQRPPWATMTTATSGSSPWTNCGNSSDSALSRGCHFDVMSFSWSLPDCFDEELMEQFLHHRDWHWYREDGAEVPVWDVRAGTFDYVFVSQEYHVVHCTYMWRKMHRAVLARRKIDSYLGNYNHTVHCEKRLHDREASLRSGSGAESEVNTVIVTKYPICGIY